MTIGAPKPKAIYPVKTIDAGSCFDIQLGNEASIRAMVSRWNRLLKPKRFLARKVSNEGVIRVWRAK